MKFDIQAPEDYPVKVTLVEENPTWDLSAYGLVLSGPITAEIDVVKSDRIYYFNGRVWGEVGLTCSRCLTEYTMAMNGHLEFSVQEVVQAGAVTKDEIPDNEILIPAGQTEIELDDAVKEALILEIPLKPLCREDCRGLCTICGADRNTELCDCKVEKTDSRWEGLRQFK